MEEAIVLKKEEATGRRREPGEGFQRAK